MYSAVGTLYISKIPFSPKVTKTILSAFLTFQKFDGFKNIGKGHPLIKSHLFRHDYLLASVLFLRTATFSTAFTSRST